MSRPLPLARPSRRCCRRWPRRRAVTRAAPEACRSRPASRHRCGVPRRGHRRRFRRRSTGSRPSRPGPACAGRAAGGRPGARPVVAAGWRPRTRQATRQARSPEAPRRRARRSSHTGRFPGRSWTPRHGSPPRLQRPSPVPGRSANCGCGWEGESARHLPGRSGLDPLRRIDVLSTERCSVFLHSGRLSMSQDVSARESRQVAEAAREQVWEKPSFAKELFLGKLPPRPRPPAPASGRRGRPARRAVPGRAPRLPDRPGRPGADRAGREDP